MKTVVLGLGNTLLGDDGVGIYALNELQSNWQDHENQNSIEFVDGGTLSFTLTETLYGADNLIVIDAAQLNTNPGEVKVFTNEEMDTFVRTSKCSSVHEVSLSELLDMARLLDTLPTRRALIGVQPETVDWADQPTEIVKQAIPVMCQEAHTLLEAWH
ncbi:MAG: HyaD/HybD family hydrogenase maturation endopeptidase [Gammaproteobacteria bacterium]|nr:HyaD/HybD family hydrogenase maturation endopeptidase [Gammaproteobacteria bacterium]